MLQVLLLGQAQVQGQVQEWALVWYVPHRTVSVCMFAKEVPLSWLCSRSSFNACGVEWHSAAHEYRPHPESFRLCVA